jgi:hypothetical protein
VDEVAATQEDNDVESVKVVLVPESSIRPVYKQTTRIQIDPRG